MPRSAPIKHLADSTRSDSSSSLKSALTPKTYRALKTEQGVFTTPPYSGELKGLWKFKDSETAKQSSSALWERFQGYKKEDDFVGMDITRKFIQMGRTRSLRYALRKGGKKYEHPTPHSKSDIKKNDNDNVSDSDDDDGKRERGREGRREIPRTGEIYDQEKLDGANIFEGYLDRCWADEIYAKAWEYWREAGKTKSKAGGKK